MISQRFKPVICSKRLLPAAISLQKRRRFANLCSLPLSSLGGALSTPRVSMNFATLYRPERAHFE